MGLYISKTFVDLHNGHLELTSVVGKGSTFAFNLPILKKAPAEVKGAMLETDIRQPKIESGAKELPETVTAASKG